MPLAGLENTTGSKLYVAAGEPAAYAIGNWKGKTWLEVVGLVSMGPWGDAVNDVSEALVSEDRVLHTNGARDGGIVPVVVQFRTTDPGFGLILTTDGGNTLLSFRKVYKSGDSECASGLITPPKPRGLSGETVRGDTFDMKVNSPMFRFTAAAWTAATAIP